MSDMYSAVDALAESLNTNTPPGKPKQPHITTWEVGVVASSTVAHATVTFPSDPALPAISLTMPYLGAQPANGSLVLVAQLPHQRIIMGVISH